jgi:hypothetical protein
MISVLKVSLVQCVTPPTAITLGSVHSSSVFQLIAITGGTEYMQSSGTEYRLTSITVGTEYTDVTQY